MIVVALIEGPRIYIIISSFFLLDWQVCFCSHSAFPPLSSLLLGFFLSSFFLYHCFHSYPLLPPSWFNIFFILSSYFNNGFGCSLWQVALIWVRCLAGSFNLYNWFWIILCFNGGLLLIFKLDGGEFRTSRLHLI